MNYRKVLFLFLIIPWLMVACGDATGTKSLATTTPNSSQATSEKQNKALVLRLYSEVFNQNKTDLVKHLLAADYIQHDPTVPGGPEGQIKLFENLKARLPGVVATVKRVAADGDLVGVHWQASATPQNENTGQAWVDLFRLANGKIVEHWDVHQDVPAKTASGNSLFSDVYKYPEGAPTLTREQEKAYKQMVVSAYSKLFIEGKLEVLDQYWDPRYYQHNPAVPNGVASVKKFFQGAQATGDPSMKILYALADQDLVWCFIQIGQDPGIGVTDIFRVADSKIIEHWDVVPDTPSSPTK